MGKKTVPEKGRVGLVQRLSPSACPNIVNRAPILLNLSKRTILPSLNVQQKFCKLVFE
jgi:hypothetical protein